MATNVEARDALAALRKRLAKVREAVGAATVHRSETGAYSRMLDDDEWEWIVNELREIQMRLVAPPTGLRAWIAALPDDACRQVVNAYRDEWDAVQTEGKASNAMRCYEMAARAFRGALLSLAPKEEAPR